MTLQSLAMVVPNSAGIYAPSRIRRSVTITEREFLMRYADYGQVINVSFEEDGISDPQPVTSYGHGFNCWGMVI